jgi:hypothetical protein
MNTPTKYLALRTGWTMAEARGNLEKLRESSTVNVEADWSLPLDAAGERTRVEHAIEVVKVLAEVAKEAGLDLEVSTLTRQEPLRKSGGTATSEQLRYLAWRRLEALGWKDLARTLGLTTTDSDDWLADWSSSKTAGLWPYIAEFLWAWDEAIQDDLAAQEFGTSSCYQLGRGLAESYWALDPSAESGSESWGHLLGEKRVSALCELLSRLSPTVLPTVTAGAITDTLMKWKRIALDPKLSGQYDAASALHDQVMLWRDLLLMAADPKDFADIGTIAKTARRSRHIVNFFAPEIVFGAITSAGLGVCLYYLTGVGTNYQAIGAAVSALGLTGSTASATIKSFSQGVMDRVRLASDQDAVIKMITRLPASKPPQIAPGWHQDGTGFTRWWDGTKWNRRPRPGARRAGAAESAQ